MQAHVPYEMCLYCGEQVPFAQLDQHKQEHHFEDILIIGAPDSGATTITNLMGFCSYMLDGQDIRGGMIKVDQQMNTRFATAKISFRPANTTGSWLYSRGITVRLAHQPKTGVFANARYHIKSTLQKPYLEVIVHARPLKRGWHGEMRDDILDICLCNEECLSYAKSMLLNFLFID